MKSCSRLLFLLFALAVSAATTTMMSSKLCKFVGTTAMASSLFLTTFPSISLATSTREVGNIETAGLLFKDKLKITSFSDEKIPGISIYLADFEKPMTEKLLAGDPFSDPASTALACVQSGAVTDKQLASIDRSASGEEVFEENKSLIFKTVRVRRVLDADKGTLLYAAYSTRFNKGDDSNKSRFKSSLCAVHPFVTTSASAPAPAEGSQ